jgi:hypothetical protein
VTAPPPSDPSTWKLPRLRIDRDGAWFHEDEEVTHEGILANLRENLQIDEQGHHLRIGPVRVPVEVEDTPFVIVRVEREGDALFVTRNDLGREPLAVYTLPIAALGVAGGGVQDGGFTARLDVGEHIAGHLPRVARLGLGRFGRALEVFDTCHRRGDRLKNNFSRTTGGCPFRCASFAA